MATVEIEINLDQININDLANELTSRPGWQDAIQRIADQGDAAPDNDLCHLCTRAYLGLPVQDEFKRIAIDRFGLFIGNNSNLPN